MYAKFAHNNKLLQHHHIYVDKEMRADCQVWKTFLTADNSVYRPFVDFSVELLADELNWYTDSSKNPKFGFGCYFNGQYAYAMWNDSEKNFIEKYDPSINFLELYGIVVSIELWCHKVKNRRVIIFSDNESAVHMVNNSSSTCKSCMRLIRILTLTSLKNNTCFFLRHVPRKFNIISDSLSRNNLSRFHKFAPRETLAAQPEKLPATVWPLRRDWFL